MRCVLDTNVIVSALLFKQSKPARAFHKVIAGGTFLSSRESLKELRTTLLRDKFDTYLTLDQRFLFLHGLLNRVTPIEPNEKISVCRDPNDNMILELAVAGNADFIITGDQDLLELDPFRAIRIMKPSEFLEIAEKDKGPAT